MSRTLAIGFTLIGLMFAGGIDVVTAATTSQLQHARAFKETQLHRDLGLVRFARRRPWAWRTPSFRVAYRHAVNRIPLERRQRRRLLAAQRELARPAPDVARWQPTVDCENGGQWADTPGYFMFGLQFDPATWRAAARHTGRWDGSIGSQIANGDWTGAEARREHQPDPWPNCPDPYFG